MIPRYSRPRMAAIWEAENRYAKWLEVELAAAGAMARRGWIPKKVPTVCRRRARVDVARCLEIERRVKHDVIAFLSQIEETVGPEARFLHYGLTSYDVVDTALGMLLAESCDLLLEGVEALLEATREQALRWRDQAMAGRTHGMHAEPITLGLKILAWHEETRRNRTRLERAREAVAVGKISGAVGTYAHLDPAIEREVCRELGLAPDPISNQVVQRDRHADYLLALAQLATSLEKFALEIRHLQRTEVGEIEEPFTAGQKGSSAMPHKRNPIISEQICGLARLMRGYALAALENNPLWHERDISNSSVERIVLPDASILMDYLLDRMTYLVREMVVYPEAMARNLAMTGGRMHSETVMLALARTGLARQAAYEIVQRNAMAAMREGRPLRELLGDDPEVARRLTARQLDAAFDPKHALRWTGAIFRRVLGSPKRAGRAGAKKAKR